MTENLKRFISILLIICLIPINSFSKKNWKSSNKVAAVFTAAVCIYFSASISFFFHPLKW